MMTLGCGGEVTTSSPDGSADGASDAAASDGWAAADGHLADTDPRCPTEKPKVGSPCSPLGLTCRRACTTTDYESFRSSWQALCSGLHEATAKWSVYGITCRPDPAPSDAAADADDA